jgi:hypothetical protein
MTKSNLPQFKGKPLIEIPEFIPRVGFLEGDFGKAVLKEYQERAEKDYGSASVLDVLFYEDGLVKGSNPFAVVLVNQIIGQEGLRTATQADLERILKTQALTLNGQHENTGLVLRTEDDPNSYLARNLMAQLKARNPKAVMPSMVPLSELELVTDANSPHQLAFKLKDSSQVFYDVFILNKYGTFSFKNIDVNTGLPAKIGQGNRYFYTTRNSMSCVGLDCGLNVCSINQNLANSHSIGRIVVVSAEGTAKNLEAYIARLTQEKAEIEVQLTAKFNGAKKALDKGYAEALRQLEQ